MEEKRSTSDDWLHFEAAINPYGCSPAVVAAIESFARSKEYRSYGEAVAESLREQLAEFHQQSPENFVVYNGAGEALAWLFVLNLIVREGRLITPYPSYERFVEAGKRCSEVVEVPLGESDFSLSIDLLIEAAKRRSATLGLISSPNNPSGNLLVTEATLSRLLDELPECLWIVDEAYADYAGISFSSMVGRYRNLVVLRTFSKAYGLAGLRIGYAIANDELAGQLARVRIPWGVNSISLVAAQAALEDQSYLREILARIACDSTKLHHDLCSLPYFRIYPSAANFFLVQIKEQDPLRLKDYLAAHRIKVRTRPDMPSHLRITSLLPEQNQRLLDVLRSFDG